MKVHRITLTLVGPLLGSAPADPDVYSTYIASKAPPGTDVLEESGLPDEKKGITVFRRKVVGEKEGKNEAGQTILVPVVDPNTCILLPYIVKGFLKSAAGAMKYVLPDARTVKGQFDRIPEEGEEWTEDAPAKPKAREGWTAHRSVIDDHVFIAPRQIELVMPSGLTYLERPLRCETPQGPRVALAKSEMAPAGTQLTFTVRLMSDKFTTRMLAECLSYGQFQGLGQWRTSDLYGQFTWKNAA
jgi:hypothetical protein